VSISWLTWLTSGWCALSLRCFVLRVFRQVREVHEETGLRVRFSTVAAIRESHSETYGGMTDLYCGESTVSISPSLLFKD
jgi:hypothetical protein